MKGSKHNYILQLENITKDFFGIKALDRVNMKVIEGEIHALVGENGSGKSTLMKIVSGIHPLGTYSGNITYKGEICEFKNIRQSEIAGIIIIHQELELVPFLSIAENIFLGNEQSKRGLINWQETEKKAKALMQIVNLNESPDTLITNLGIGKKQLVEIAKALSKKVKLLILDEPTAALNKEDSYRLLDLLLELKKQGITSILISHKLEEICYIADSVTILRDGVVIETIVDNVRNTPQEKIIKSMVGREYTERFPKRKTSIGDVLFEVKNWNAYHPIHRDRKIVDNVSINVRKGEVVGIAGLMGAGRTEFTMSLFGRSYGQKISGKVYKNNKEISVSTVDSSIKNGLAYITEDRKKYGLILNESIKNNITLTSLKKISKMGVINDRKEVLEATKYKNQMDIKAKDVFQILRNLSGGNQQKIVLSKWIFSDADILILDEPTRGIDVGAKYEIYNIINDLASKGKGIILISSDLLEILGLCDRIYVMHNGIIKGEFLQDSVNQEDIMKCIIMKE
ncbi:MAG: sugar ABC transporter ATP-binding protein [Actinomycetota bacterium]